ncbi:hypothetical protein VTO42DRAFT_6511 [Malbranchea cinnamomea]
MRGRLHHSISRQHRNEPFVLTLTDLHPSNIFVDDGWHITAFIDLELACPVPIELQIPPYCLTCRTIDDIEHGEHLETFEAIVTEFIDTFEEQEIKQNGLNAFQAQIMRGTAGIKGASGASKQYNAQRVFSMSSTSISNDVSARSIVPNTYLAMSSVHTGAQAHRT